MGPDSVIEADGLTRTFGGLVAVEDYGLSLAPGDLVGLIGPNGAGKTTAFNLLTGVLKPTAGTIRVRGRELTGSRPSVMARAGIARSFQSIRLFNDLSVLENVMCGGHMRHGAPLLATLAQLPSFWRSEKEIAQLAAGVIERCGLADHLHQRAGHLSYGDQRRVEIARALATEPSALLLDEPAAGLNPSETQALADLIRKLNAELGTAVLLVEHDMRLVMNICRRVQVLNRGRMVAEGTPEEVQADPAVLEAYLGTRRRRTVLEVEELHVFRGATHVLKGISFEVQAGEVAALIGANGAGKSTTLLTLSGLIRARSGRATVRLDKRMLDLLRSPPEQTVRAGIVHCPEGRQVFQSLTVAENLALGAYTRTDTAEVAHAIEDVYALFPILKHRAHLAAGTLSGGEQMMLALGRALVASPRLLLLDEPSLGLAPKMVETIFDVIAGLKDRGVTILLIEQNAAMALEIADRAYVIENGRIVLSGTGAELAENDEVRHAYLGVAL